MTILALILIVFFASTLQATTGFGFAILSIPFYLLIFEPHDAIQLNVLLSFIICIIVSYRIRQRIDKGLLIRLIKGSLIGALPGIALFIFLDDQPLKIFISIIILISAALLITKLKLKGSKTQELIAGAFSGLLNTSTGMGGPPLMIYFLGTKTDKAIIHAATNAYFVFIALVSFLLQIMVHPVSKFVWTAALGSIPFLLAGMFLGQWLFTKINQQLFMKIIYLLLIISGLYMLLSNI